MLDNVTNMQDELTSQHTSLLPKIPVSRRGFVVASLATGYTAMTGTVSAQAISTPADGLTAGEVKIKTADGDMPAYRAVPAGKANAPVVLVVQEVFGVHEYIKDTCRRMAKLGYMAIAPELYARQGDASKYTAADIPKLFADIVSKVPDAQVMSDLDACVAWAKGQGADSSKLAVTGFCWGGRITWLYSAHNKGVKAGVAWYGRLVGDATPNTPKHPLELVNALNGPVLGLYGAADSGIPQDTVARMIEALGKSSSKAAKASDFVVYPDAPHAFHADYRPSFRKGPAEDGWQRMHAWFKANGVV
jgi:carboxymethylenebutenolidase